MPSLFKLLSNDDVTRTIVFTRTKRGANTVAQKLDRGGVRAVAIHGNKSQNARQKALGAFRRKQVTVLVATDVAARGIDIDGVSHVVNFDMPVEPESYVHRIGRTGRAKAEGVAISFCTSDERDELRAIESLIGQRLTVESTDPGFDASHSSPKKSSRGKASRGDRARQSRTKGRRGAKRTLVQTPKSGASSCSGRTATVA